jgi:hypothetical protein
MWKGERTNGKKKMEEGGRRGRAKVSSAGRRRRGSGEKKWMEKGMEWKREWLLGW